MRLGDEVAAGEQQAHCSDAQTVFSPSIDLAELGFNQLLCVRRVGHPESEMELVFYASEISFEAQYFNLLVIPFEAGLPSRTDISALTQGLVYQLNINVTDGNTGFVYAAQSFLYQGETTMVLQSLSEPEARISSPTEVECDGPRRGTVVLDGSASTPGDPAGTITSHEWFVDFGQPGERSIGSGPVLTTALPLGENEITLRVTDGQGKTTSAQAMITVRDTTVPTFELTLDRTRLWPPNPGRGGAPEGAPGGLHRKASRIPADGHGSREAGEDPARDRAPRVATGHRSGEGRRDLQRGGSPGQQARLRQGDRAPRGLAVEGRQRRHAGDDQVDARALSPGRRPPATIRRLTPVGGSASPVNQSSTPRDRALK